MFGEKRKTTQKFNELVKRIIVLENEVNKLDVHCRKTNKYLVKMLTSGLRWHDYFDKRPEVGRVITAICYDDELRKGTYTAYGGIKMGWCTWIAGFMYWAYIPEKKKRAESGDSNQEKRTDN